MPTSQVEDLPVDSHRGNIFLTGACPFPPTRDRQGHKMNEISFAPILLATACPGCPFDILRAVSSVERPHPAGGEFHKMDANHLKG